MALPTFSEEKGFHSALYLDDPRVFQLDISPRISENFSRKLFKTAGRCLFGETKDLESEMSIFYRSQVHQTGETVFFPELTRHVNQLFSAYIKRIVSLQTEKRGAIEIAIHKRSRKHLASLSGLSLTKNALRNIRQGDFFKFGGQCAGGVIGGIEYYSGGWFVLSFNKTKPKEDEAFVNLINYALKQFNLDDAIANDIFIEVNKEFERRKVTLNAEFVGIPALQEMVKNIRDIREFKVILDSLKTRLTRVIEGKVVALEYLPWSTVDGFDLAFNEYLESLNDDRPWPLEDIRFWNKFYQHLELSFHFQEEIFKLANTVNRFEYCHSELNVNYPLTSDSKDRLFLDHYDPTGPGISLEKVHNILSDKKLKEYKSFLGDFMTRPGRSFESCRAILSKNFTEKSYQEISECQWIDSYRTLSDLFIKKLCPVTPLAL